MMLRPPGTLSRRLLPPGGEPLPPSWHLLPGEQSQAMGAHTSQNSPRGHILLPGVQKLSELMRKAACQRQPGDQGPRRLFQADAGLGPTPDRARAERRGETHFPGRGPSSLGQGVNPESSAPTPGSLPPMPLGRSPAGALQGEPLPPEGTWGGGRLEMGV